MSQPYSADRPKSALKFKAIAQHYLTTQNHLGSQRTVSAVSSSSSTSLPEPPRSVNNPLTRNQRRDSRRTPQTTQTPGHSPARSVTHRDISPNSPGIKAANAPLPLLHPIQSFSHASAFLTTTTNDAARRRQQSRPQLAPLPLLRLRLAAAEAPLDLARSRRALPQPLLVHPQSGGTLRNQRKNLYRESVSLSLMSGCTSTPDLRCRVLLA